MTRHTPDIAALGRYADVLVEHADRIETAVKEEVGTTAWLLAWSIVDAHKPHLDAAHRAAFIDTEAL